MAGASKVTQDGKVTNYYSIPGNRRVVQGSPDEAVNTTNKADKENPSLGVIMNEAAKRGQKPSQKDMYKNSVRTKRKSQWI